MKEYKVILKDKRQEFVRADDHGVVGEERRFYADGQLIPDVFFKEVQVYGVIVEKEDADEEPPDMFVG